MTDEQRPQTGSGEEPPPRNPPPPSYDVAAWKDEILFELRDRDGDGTLDPGEFERTRELTQVFKDPSAFERYDLNKDERIDREEWLRTRAAERAEPND